MLKKISINYENLKILKLIQDNGRISHSEIGTLVGLSVPAVTERIRKLEQAGFIKQYAAVLDAAKLGNDITAFINVTIKDPKAYRGFADSIRHMGEVLECHHVVGGFDYILKIKTRNAASLESLISRHIRVIKGVERTITNIVLSSVKETTHIDIGIDTG